MRERSIGEHVEMAKMLHARQTEKAARMLRVHILVINDSLDLLPLKPALEMGGDAGSGERAFSRAKTAPIAAAKSRSGTGRGAAKR